MFSSHMDNFLSLSWGNASGLIKYQFWILYDYDIGTQGQINRCFSWCSFVRLWCLWRQLRPVSYIQMRKKRRTMGEAVKLPPQRFPWLLMLLHKPKLDESLLLVALALLIASFWVKSQPKLEGNSLKTLLFCDGLALYDGYYAYQQD